MLPLVIKSHGTGDRLVIDPGRPDYWTATLDCSDLQASHTFYEDRIESLPDFLTNLARRWRGWEGEQTWGSLEGDVALTAAHDGRGTVTLLVTLRNNAFAVRGAGGWNAQAVLTLDAGTALERLAREATLWLP